MRTRRLLPLATLIALAAPAAAQAETITYTGAGEKTFVVPAGVTSLRVDAVGGSGGTGRCQPLRNGGFGARLSTTLRVIPGTPLYAFVAANGAAGRGDNINAVASLLGGGGAGGASGVGGTCGGGAGGDATSVGLVSNAPPLGIGQTDAWLASRRLVAGGGGGGGGGGSAMAGGVGGDAGGPLGDGGQGGGATGAGGGSFPGYGGRAGSATSGGERGMFHFGAPAGSGALGQGGFGASWPDAGGGDAGGGGGGLFGGGGGGIANTTAMGAGGGGAGSSFAHPDVTSGTTLATDSTGVPSITLTWSGPGGAPAPPGAGTTGGGQGRGTTVQTAARRVVLNTFIDRRPRTVVRTRRDRTTVSFAFSSNVDGVRFRCKLDQRPSTSCSSGKRYTVSRGFHRFRVWSVVNGKADSTPASFSFQVVRRR